MELKILSLQNINALNEGNILEICKNMKNIKELDLFDCKNVKEKELMFLNKYSFSLEKVRTPSG